MPRAKRLPPEDGMTKFQRYRRGQLNKGMKLLPWKRTGKRNC